MKKCLQITTMKRPSNASPAPSKKQRVNSKIIKVPNKRPGSIGFTIVAAEGARIGDTGVIDGVEYTIRSEEQLRNLIMKGRYDDVMRTCTSKVCSMRFMFLDKKNFNEPIGHWDTSNVTSMKSVFEYASAFNQPIGGWDTARVVDMSEMFREATAFNQPIKGWRTGCVKNMAQMFRGAKSFNQYLGTWNTGNVTDMSGMFRGATSFNGSIGRWDTGRVEYMNEMFSYASSFTRDISKWNTSSLKGARGIFLGAKSFASKKGWLLKYVNTTKRRATRSRKSMIKSWTNSNPYKRVQDARRGVANITRAERSLNDAIAQQMRDSGMKTPLIPKGFGKVRYLYRGVHGPFAEQIIEHGGMREYGFIPFSRSQEVAENFARGGIVLRIRIDELPPGIPWIWFDGKNKRSRNTVRSAWNTEEEVLLPPGALVIEKLYDKIDYLAKRFFDAKYIPDTTAKSLSGKTIIRKLGPAKRNAQTRMTTYDRHLENMFQRVMSLK